MSRGRSSAFLYGSVWNWWLTFSYVQISKLRMRHYLALTILFMLPEVHYKNKLYQSNPILYSFLYPTSEKACFKKTPQTSRFYLTGTEFSKVFTELNRISIMPLQKIQLRGEKKKKKKSINSTRVFLKLWRKWSAIKQYGTKTTQTSTLFHT